MPWKPDGRAQQTSPERILPRTRWFQHWEHSQQPSPTQPSSGEPRRVGKQLQNSMIRCGWKYGDWEWNANFKKGRPEEEKLSIALYRGRQLMRRKRPTSTSRRRSNQVRHHECKGHRHRRRHALRSWKNREWMAQQKKVEDLDGRTNIVHQHFNELFRRRI